ncbi:GbsR/MarR family transcriptional regulator [Jannaschia sp. S6380]|uniref:GbsR/MarR family transcriptional regulator n=1 Tax=Jannaschia sp. S6380 TaxID=2926408 RepID=UPI001FF1C799|nr:GbsR/MarR family transcriptional regulator [Jannaschia sp. S6380]MCK0168074.1 GbsR/MarR family transcriptional regulator [Jannaschia sp. S6380]
MALSTTHQEFVLHFGEMGSRWGINRTVGQIYALLFLSEAPLNAEQITTQLSISRSNTSMGLKELQSWNLVRLRHYPGDRRDYFTTPDDLWEIVRTLVSERRKREIDPTLTKLRELEMSGPQGDPYAEARIAELREMIEMMTQFHDEMERLETERLVQLMTMGRKLGSLFDRAPRMKLWGKAK